MREWHQHISVCTKMERSIFLHSQMHRPFATFSWLDFSSGPFRYRLLCTLPRLSHPKSCNHHGLFAVQKFNGLDILPSSLSILSNLLVFPTSSYMLFPIVSHIFLYSAWTPCLQFTSPMVFLSNLPEESQPLII